MCRVIISVATLLISGDFSNHSESKLVVQVRNASVEAASPVWFVRMHLILEFQVAVRSSAFSADCSFDMERSPCPTSGLTTSFQKTRTQ